MPAIGKDEANCLRTTYSLCVIMWPPITQAAGSEFNNTKWKPSKKIQDKYLKDSTVQKGCEDD